MPIADTVTIKPDMRVVHPDLGDITEDVARELANIRREENEALVRDAERLQAQIAAGTPGEAIIHDGWALKAQIHPKIVAYWRMREGPGFWKHELGNFLKKFPSLRVKARSPRPTLLMPGLRGSEPLAEPLAGRRGPTGRRGRWALA